MKIKVKTICSVIAVVAWCVLVYQRSALGMSGKCDTGTPCDPVTLILISLAGLYISLELLIAPEFAALYILSKTLSRGRTSPREARGGGFLGAIMWLLILCWGISQLFGPHP